MTTTLTLTVPGPALTGSCPDCGGNIEGCTCTGGVAPQARTVLAPRAGAIDDIGREDDQSGQDGSGYERDETDQFHQLVQQLVDDGDARARSAGRQARRTLAEMLPGYVRQPVLRLTRALPMRGADDSCPVCGRWSCKGSDCPPNSGVTRSLSTAGTGGR